MGRDKEGCGRNEAALTLVTSARIAWAALHLLPKALAMDSPATTSSASRAVTRLSRVEIWWGGGRERYGLVRSR